MAYFLDLTDEERKDRADQLCTDITPGIVVSRGMDIPEALIKAANDSGTPILKSPRKTTRVISRLTNYLEIKFAPFTAIHGVLVDIKDRKSTRLNSSHVSISYAVFCLK